jgi:hypothetical protein
MINEESTISIPKLYRRKAFDLLMFGFIEGMKSAMPTLTIQECIVMFNKKIDTRNEDYSIEVNRTTYNRMKKEYYDTL